MTDRFGRALAVGANVVELGPGDERAERARTGKVSLIVGQTALVRWTGREDEEATSGEWLLRVTPLLIPAAPRHASGIRSEEVFAEVERLHAGNWSAQAIAEWIGVDREQVEWILDLQALDHANLRVIGI